MTQDFDIQIHIDNEYPVITFWYDGKIIEIQFTKEYLLEFKNKLDKFVERELEVK